MLKLLGLLLLTCIAAGELEHSTGSSEMVEHEHEEHVKCEANENSTTACTYRNIVNSYEFHEVLLTHTNRSQAALITTMNFEDSFMDNIPKELFQIYKNLEVLNVDNANLERLESFDFLPNKVKFFNLSNNRIYKLGAKMLISMNNLTSLDLSHNVIERINPTAFVKNPNFKYLNMSHNLVRKLDLKFFSELESLEVLKLDHNMISDITGDFTNFKPQWKELYLQHNNLITLSPMFVASVQKLDLSLNNMIQADFKSTKLIELHMSYNELKYVSINKNLEVLDLTGNSGNIMRISFEDNSSLKSFELSDCILSSMKEVMATLNRFKSLVYLDLSGTRVEFHEDVFKGLDALKTLKLVDAVNEKTGNIFYGLKSLVELDYGSNHLDQFDLRDLESSKNLEKLGFRSCNMHELYNWQNVLSMFPKLNHVDLHGNYFMCDKLNDIANKFRKLNIVVEELEDINNDFRVTDGCLNSTSPADNSSHVNHSDAHKENQSAMLWYSCSFLALLFIAAGVIYLNQRFELFERAMNFLATKRNSRTYSGGLLDSENYSETNAQREMIY